MGAVQYSTVYRLIGPDGTQAVFNDPTDTNYVGVLSSISGLDSPEIRESAEELVGMDGGVHGDFYYGRRPIVLEGLLLNPASVVDRNQRADRLHRASDALRADATLAWQAEGMAEQSIRVRRHQPLRMEGTWQKSYQLALVAEDPRIYSFVTNSVQVLAEILGGSDIGRGYDRTYDIDYGPANPNGQVLATNAGTTLTYPVLTVTGPGTNPSISNLTTGETLYLNYELAADELLTLDMLNRTVLLNGTASRYSAVDFIRSDWWGLMPGLNDVRVSFTTHSTGASLRIDWRDAWL
jgi:hypothetical protein